MVNTTPKDTKVKRSKPSKPCRDVRKKHAKKRSSGRKTFYGGYLPEVMMTNDSWAWQIWTDSYKMSHTLMYSPKATKMVAYGEPRGALKGFKTLTPGDKRIVFCGVKYIVDTYIKNASTSAGYQLVTQFLSHHYNTQKFPYNSVLLDKLAEQTVPIRIEALAEGTVILPHTPVYQLIATGENSPFVTFFETILTMTWYPMTIATICQYAKDMLRGKTYKLYVDYGVCTCIEQAEIAKQSIELVFGTDKFTSELPQSNVIDFDLENLQQRSSSMTGEFVIYVGTKLLQTVNRDSVNFATKLNYVEEGDDKYRFIMKAPLGQPDKRSLPGELAVIRVQDTPKVYSKVPGESDDFENRQKYIDDNLAYAPISRSKRGDFNDNLLSSIFPNHEGHSPIKLIDDAWSRINKDKDARSDSIQTIQQFVACKNHDNKNFMQFFNTTTDENGNIVEKPRKLIKSAQDVSFPSIRLARLNLMSDNKVDSDLKLDEGIDNDGAETLKKDDKLKKLANLLMKVSMQGGKKRIAKHR